MKCISLGCTSGNQNNPEKVSFFCVPRDPKLASLWKKSCKIDTFKKLNCFHRLCEKHFLEEDIIRKKVLRYKDGRIVQEIPLQKIYLRKGAVPVLFPWTTFPTNEENNLKSIEHNSENKDSQSIKDADIMETLKSENQFTFYELKCSTNINLPADWSRHVVSFQKSERLLFCKLVCVCKTDEDFDFVPQKEVIIKTDLTFEARVLKTKIDIKQYGFCGNLNSVEAVTVVIKLLDKFNICAGSANDSDKVNNVVYKDCLNKTRHVKCILITSRQRCKFCTRTTLIKKRSRVKEREKIKKICLDNVLEV